MTYSFKGYVKIFKIYMVNFNVAIFNRLKIMGFFINKRYDHTNDIIFNKTFTKLFIILKKSFLQILNGTGCLKHSANFTRKHLCWSLFSMKLQAY